MPYKKNIFCFLTGYIPDLTMKGAYMKLSALSTAPHNKGAGY